MKKIATLLVLFFTAAFAQQGTLTDSRDGKKYKTVKIGNQVWMAENLNYEAKDIKSECYGNSSSEKQKNCNKYGRLYEWEEAKKACPTGWHLPINIEWDVLSSFIDNSIIPESPYESEIAGKYLKSKDGWNHIKKNEGKESGNGIDNYGFTALPGGYHYGNFTNVGSSGYWWSASANSSINAYYRIIDNNSEKISWNHDSKKLKLSVRCVQDEKKIVQQTEQP